MESLCQLIQTNDEHVVRYLLSKGAALLLLIGDSGITLEKFANLKYCQSNTIRAMIQHAARGEG